MIFPFYNNDEKAYTINDANYDCGRIIVADCDNWHKYATLCELVAECPEMKQLTKPCIVDALNNLNTIPNTQSLDPSKWFLKVTPDWCLAVADPCVCNNWDRYVAASDQDNNPWPLDKKVKWSCSADWLYCIDIEEAWPQLLVWRPSGPNGPYINPDLPSDDSCSEEWWDVRLKKSWSEWKVTYVCPEADTKPQYCKCVYSWWLSATPWILWSSDPRQRKWRTVRYFLPIASCSNKPVDDWSIDWATSYVNWDWRINWTTECFAKPQSYWVVRITQPWQYLISFSTYITFHQTLHSIRCWLYIDEWNGPKEINDIKYQVWEYPHQDWTGFNPVIFNRLFPAQYDDDVFTRNKTRYWWTLENTWLPFSRSYVLHIPRACELFMAVKPDMRDQDPRVEENNDYEWRYNIQVEWYNSDAYWAATSIEISRVWETINASRLIPIN